MMPELTLALPQVAFGCLLIGLVVQLAVIDSRHMILPNTLNAMLAASGLAQAVVIGRPHVLDAVLGALLGAAVLGGFAALYRRVRGIDGLGRGDVKFAAAAGLWIGWQDVSLMLFVAAWSALIFVAVQAARTGEWHLTTRVPFGPFLAIGTVAAWLGAVVAA